MNLAGISFTLQQISCMYRIGLILLCGFIACKGKKTAKDENVFTFESFSEKFASSSLPYVLTDTGLQKNSDTTTIRAREFADLIPDSIKNRIFSKGSKVRYTALKKINVPKAETYFIVKATANTKRAALLVTFDKEGNYAATFPFLVVDDNPNTSQSSSIDKAYSISRTVVRRSSQGDNAEGKDVYVYNDGAKQYTLIMTDLLDEGNIELVNPIDTFSRKNKFAGDYYINKQNLVSIRDGRSSNQLLAFVHIDNKDENCSGEIKGNLLLTSGTTAVYRQGGDPCAMQFTFSGSSVTLREEQGCGNHRGLNCAFNGTFTRKKPIKPKTSTKKSTKK